MADRTRDDRSDAESRLLAALTSAEVHENDDTPAGQALRDLVARFERDKPVSVQVPIWVELTHEPKNGWSARARKVPRRIDLSSLDASHARSLKRHARLKQIAADLRR
jgi:hypothetical protein